MKTYQPMKILAPVDFSETSLDALQAAAGLAGAGAEVHVLHVAEDRHYVAGFASTPISVSKIKDDAYLALESDLEILAKKVSTPAQVKTVLIWGDPPKDIVKIAESGDFDLVVMATHGRRGLNRFFVGSVTEEVMRRAPCSVLALRVKAGEAERAEVKKEIPATV